MLPDSPTRTAPPRLSFARFGSFSLLFQHYCTQYDALAAYYAGDFRDPDALHAAADRAAAHPRDREALADLLLDQNARWGLDDATRANIERLRTPDSAAVVTGQQIGLFVSPLYTPYKLLTAIQLARRLTEQTGRPTVPVFWLAGEDHDYEEIAGVRLLHQNQPAAFRYDAPIDPDHPGPVGRIVLSDAIADVLAGIDDALPPSDFKPALMDRLRDTYRPGTTLLDAFARLLRTFFPDDGVVFVSPDDVRLKRLAAPLFQQEIEDFATPAAAAQQVSDRLAETYHVQVHLRPTNLFLLHDAGRFPIDATEAGPETRFALRSREETFSREALLDLLNAHPDRFSPNVVLRPVLQDLLFPTAAYVAGPSEVSYFAQYKPVYEWAGVPMPIIYPRASVTLVEPKVRRQLDRFDLSLPDYGDELDRLFRRVVLEAMDGDLEAAFRQAAGHLHASINDLKPAIERIDRTLVKTAEATRASLLKEMDRFKDRVVKAEKRNQDAMRGQLEKVQANLFPERTLQERALAPVYFLNKYGPDLFTRLGEVLSLDTAAHQIVDL